MSFANVKRPFSSRRLGCLLFITGLLFIGCSTEKTQGISGAPNESQQESKLGEPEKTKKTRVALSFQLDTSEFEPGSQVSIAVRSEVDMENARHNADCHVSRDTATGKEVVTCPQGVQPRPVPKPWTQTVSVDKLTGSYSVEPSNIGQGEEFELHITGNAKDGCNSASARVKKRADSAAMDLGRLEVMSTEMGCLP